MTDSLQEWERRRIETILWFWLRQLEKLGFCSPKQETWETRLLEETGEGGCFRTSWVWGTLTLCCVVKVSKLEAAWKSSGERWRENSDQFNQFLDSLGVKLFVLLSTSLSGHGLMQSGVSFPSETRIFESLGSPSYTGSSVVSTAPLPAPHHLSSGPFWLTSFVQMHPKMYSGWPSQSP